MSDSQLAGAALRDLALSSTRTAATPVSQRVYLTLRQMLMVGGFQPGESVSLRTLAKRLGTSAMPVREAVNRLMAEQALQMLPNRQVIVRRMTRRKLLELTRIRQALEGMMAGDACENMAEPLLRRLERDHRKMLAVLPTAPMAEILTRNKDFHFAFYGAARSEVLLPIVEGLWMQTGPFQALSLSRQRSLWQAHRHTALLEALRRRDRRAAVNAIKGDIADVSDMLLEIGEFDE
ncbi:MAG TPA: GntR family transcriptional regulator [Pseudolabrys sp.]|nr:GntR family transcriptional regulator [Pseudolabrys sp.]